MSGLDDLRDYAGGCPGLRRAVDAVESDLRAMQAAADERYPAWEWVERHGGLGAVKGRLMPEGVTWPTDARGVRIMPGDTVWANGGEHGDGRAWYVERVSPGCRYPVRASDANGEKRDLKPGWLTHERPAPKVLDADGVEICEGDTVWTTRDLDRFTVTNPNNGKFLSVSCKGEDGEDYCCYPTDLTHRAPVLAADGKPLREGETVWHVNSGNEYIVRKLTRGGAQLSKGDKPGGYCRADYLTHERPDSWERLEDDAAMQPYAYCVGNGLLGARDEDEEMTPTNELFARDLVRRAKKLAGVE